MKEVYLHIPVMKCHHHFYIVFGRINLYCLFFIAKVLMSLYLDDILDLSMLGKGIIPFVYLILLRLHINFQV